jgi:Ca2+-binding RTX toxin-like protein
MRAALLPISLLLAVSLPSAALAVPTAEYSDGKLTVTGDETDEIFTIKQEGLQVRVYGPHSMPDPDGAALTCTSIDFGQQIRCADILVDAVVVNGGAGVDTMTNERGLTADTETLNGDEGNDQLVRNVPQSYSLILDGGPGNDKLDAGATGSLGVADHGGDGDDMYLGSPIEPDAFVADPGADTYIGGSAPVRIEDSMTYGSTVEPQIVSLDGVANDGRAGEHDNVKPDIEKVFGGGSGDRLSAGAISAELYGGPGADQLVGGPADDWLDGQLGNDVILGGGGDDGLLDGDETPQVQDPQLPPAGNDRLDGGAGSDRLMSDRGADDLHGGTGYDYGEFIRVIPRAPTAPSPSRPAPFAISLDDRANDGQRGTDEHDNVHTDVEEVFTWNGDDVLVGSPGPDTLASEGGNDRIVPGGGADLVAADDGADVVIALDGATDRIDCGPGADRLQADLPGSEPDRADVAFNCETITGTPLGAAADTRAPRLVVKGIRSRMTRRAFNRGIKLRVGADEAIAAEITLRVGRVVMADASLRRSARTRTVRLRPTLRLSGRGTARARVRVVAFDAAGNRAVKTRSFRVTGRRR